jgi:hypothetical protein
MAAPRTVSGKTFAPVNASVPPDPSPLEVPPVSLEPVAPPPPVDPVPDVVVVVVDVVVVVVVLVELAADTVNEIVFEAATAGSLFPST